MIWPSLTKILQRKLSYGFMAFLDDNLFFALPKIFVIKQMKSNLIADKSRHPTFCEWMTVSFVYLLTIPVHRVGYLT